MEVDRDQFAIRKDEVKVFFKPISRKGKTRKWWKARKEINGMHERPDLRDYFGKKIKNIYIHTYMVLEMEEKDK